MRTLSTNTDNGTQATITTPGYLVQIDASVVIRLSSRNDQSWNGESWTGGRIHRISGVGAMSTGERRAKLEVINTDLAYSALVLNNQLADTPIQIWKFYNDNPAVADPVLVFAGVIDAVTVSPSVVAFRLSSENTRTYYSPRKFINASSGFNHLRPAGTRITWGGEVYVLERNP